MEEFQCQVCGKFITQENGVTLENGIWCCDNNICRGILGDDNEPIEIKNDDDIVDFFNAMMFQRNRGD